jgi:Flp pilus assembly protein TadG
MKTNRVRGAVAVDFALVLPILLAIFLGIFEFGLALYDKAVITNASREAARMGVVLRNPKRTTTEIQLAALNHCQAHLLGGSATPVVTVAGAGGGFGTELSVEVSFDYDGFFLGKLVAAGFSTPLVLASTTVMLNE